jgi:glycerate-2-kinase
MRRRSLLLLVPLAAALASCAADEGTNDYAWCRSVRVALDGASDAQSGDQSEVGSGPAAVSSSTSELLNGIVEGAPAEVEPHLRRLIAATNEAQAPGDPAAIEQDLEVVSDQLQALCGFTFEGLGV